MSFFDELKRRNVFRVGLAYLIAAWLVLQVVDVIGPMLSLPDWVGPTILLLLAVGFVVSVFIAWAYEVTPEGIKRERDVDRSASITHVTGRKLDFVVIAVLVVALAFFALDKFVWQVQEVELEKSIAVIPFANRSDDEADENFVNGIHDDILTQLANLSGIDKVISRTSVEQYRNTEKTMPEIAAELGVATILEGGVQRAGNNIRINVQLISAEDQHLWAENYDRELTIENMFAIQSEISTAIANELSAALTEEDQEELANLPTNSLEAWEKYQLGKFVMRDRSTEGLAQGYSLFREAIELDKEFALAYVGLADSITLGNIYGWETESNAPRLDEGQAAANRALELNPRLGEAYTSLGYAQFYLAMPDNILKADAYYQQALDLTPNYIDLLRWYPQVLWLYPLNQPQKALEIAERAVALDPANPINHTVLAAAYEVNDLYEEALASIQRAKEILPTLVYTNWEHVGLLRRHGDFLGAVLVGLETQKIVPDHPRVLWEVSESFRHLGLSSYAAYWQDRVSRTGQSFYASLIEAANAYDQQDFGAAVQQYELALTEWDHDFPVIQELVRSYLLNDQPGTILELIERTAPEMLDREQPRMFPQGVFLVPAVAWALRMTGESDRAAKLIDLGLRESVSSPRQAFFGYGIEIADIELYALKGDHQSALNSLTQAVADGYRYPLWLQTSPLLDPLRSEPEFIAAMEIIDEEMARQRAELEQMERNGEMPPLPE